MNRDLAQAEIRAFSPDSTPWRLDWPLIADRLAAIVETPTLIDQAEQNLCGPATFFVIWFTEDPLAATRFALDLYRDGVAHIGELAVAPGENSLIERTHADLKLRIPGSDWMLLGSLRDSENELASYKGDGADSLTGVTLPGEFSNWLMATGCFAAVHEETSLLSQSVEHAHRALECGDYVAALISSRMLSEVLDIREKRSFLALLQQSVPNHWVWLRSLEVKADVELEIWSYGRLYRGVITREEFERDYYGSIIAVRSGTN